MNPTNFSVSTCSLCKNYILEGQRGGHCRALNVAVGGRWKSCVLAEPPFPAFLEPIEAHLFAAKQL